MTVDPRVRRVVSRNSNDVNFMRLHGNNSEAGHQLVCDRTRRLRLETPETLVGWIRSPNPDGFVPNELAFQVSTA